MTPIDEDDRPLDPDMVRVERKLRRLVAVSGLIMAAGLIAVFAAIFYRLAVSEPAVSPPAGTAELLRAQGGTPGPVDLEVAIPSGATVDHTFLADGALVITLRLADGRNSILIVGADDGRVRRRITLTPTRVD